MENYLVTDGSITATQLNEVQIKRENYPYKVIGIEKGDTDEFGWCTIHRETYYCTDWKGIKQAYFHWLNEVCQLSFSLEDISEDDILGGFYYDPGYHDYNSTYQLSMEKR